MVHEVLEVLLQESGGEDEHGELSGHDEAARPRPIGSPRPSAERHEKERHLDEHDSGGDMIDLCASAGPWCRVGADRRRAEPEPPADDDQHRGQHDRQHARRADTRWHRTVGPSCRRWPRAIVHGVRRTAVGEVIRSKACTGGHLRRAHCSQGWVNVAPMPTKWAVDAANRCWATSWYSGE